jgi:uncharacterized protein YdcH (DUF465 family)
MADPQLREDDVKATLLRTDEGFKQLVSEHHALDEQVRHLASQSYLTQQQQYEAAQLKKRKLALKDRIEAVVRGRAGGDFAAARQ